MFEFNGLAMIEHVRRRALLAKGISDVYVATCDKEIADLVRSHGGRVILTSDQHLNGTSRVAEAINTLDCSHVILLQGDEPLLLPRHVEAMIAAIKAAPENDAWNATAPINAPDELDRHSFVKCAVGNDGNILYSFRRSPSIAPFDIQRLYIRKILGIIAYRRPFLLSLAQTPTSVVERNEFIEQMRIIESGGSLKSVPVDESLPSVNEPNEAAIVLEYLNQSIEQQELLRGILG